MGGWRRPRSWAGRSPTSSFLTSKGTRCARGEGRWGTTGEVGWGDSWSADALPVRRTLHLALRPTPPGPPVHDNQVCGAGGSSGGAGVAGPRSAGQNRGRCAMALHPSPGALNSLLLPAATSRTAVYVRTAQTPPPTTGPPPPLPRRPAPLPPPPPGMRDGVLHAQHFVLFLTEGVFSRWFCKMEIRTVPAQTPLRRRSSLRVQSPPCPSAVCGPGPWR